MAFPLAVSADRAANLLFTGDTIDAAEALRIGLVNRVVPSATLDDEAIAFAARLAATLATERA